MTYSPPKGPSPTMITVGVGHLVHNTNQHLGLRGRANPLFLSLGFHRQSYLFSCVSQTVYLSEMYFYLHATLYQKNVELLKCRTVMKPNCFPTFGACLVWKQVY